LADKLTVREYQPGRHTLVYIPFNPLAEITGKCFHPDRTCKRNVWARLGSEQVFTLNIDFDSLGDWLFLIYEDGIFTVTLKAKVTP